MVQSILDKNNGIPPQKMPDQHINYCLKEIGELAEINEVVEKIRKYLQEGFYFAYNYDLTSNLQRQRVLYEEHGFAAKDHVQESFSWNKNLFK